jgi:hypothetical protein
MVSLLVCANTRVGICSYHNTLSGNEMNERHKNNILYMALVSITFTLCIHPL